MRKMNSRTLVVAAVVILSLDAVGLANGTGENKRCEKTPKVGYSVTGTLVSMTTDDAGSTDAFEGSIAVDITRANGHARKSGDIADQNATQEGVQVAGATSTVSGDAYKLMLKKYEDADTPSAGDTVKVIGRIPRTRAKCAAEDTSLADRYGAPDVRKVSVTDADPDV